MPAAPAMLRLARSSRHSGGRRRPLHSISMASSTTRPAGSRAGGPAQCQPIQARLHASMVHAIIASPSLAGPLPPAPLDHRGPGSSTIASSAAASRNRKYGPFSQPAVCWPDGSGHQAASKPCRHSAHSTLAGARRHGKGRAASTKLAASRTTAASKPR
ncbi:hypothetical protein D3C72_1072880 [compost metagenome]